MLRILASIAPSIAAAMSASSNTRNGALPPSSIDVRSTCSEACSSSFRPTPVEPVKESLRARPSRISGSITPPASLVTTTLTTPPGRAASARISASASIDSGVCEAGLITDVQPAAMAGPSLRPPIAIGKFHGVMSTHGPTGCFMTRNRPLPLGAVAYPPSMRTASSANQRKNSAAYSTSPFASATGLPISRVISSARSSARSTRIWYARRRISPRSRGAYAAHAGCAETAASSASIPSAGVASATSHSTSPVAGSCTGSVLPPATDRHFPPMNRSLGTASTTAASRDASPELAISHSSPVVSVRRSMLCILSTILQTLPRPTEHRGHRHIRRLSCRRHRSYAGPSRQPAPPSQPTRERSPMTQLSPHLKQATPVLAARGEGVHIYDEAGRRYLDFTAGIGVTSTGHCHPKVVAAAQQQVATLIHGQYTTVMHRPLLTLIERLGDVLPEGLDSLFFVNSGSEAVEASLRLARQATGRPNLIAFEGGFHGRTIGAATLTTSGTKVRAGFAPLMGGVYYSPFPYAYRYGWDEATATRFALQELDFLFATQSAPNDTAAFIVEPVLGEGGYVPANAEFLRGLRERADRYGIQLIIDEVQTGFGRTGKFWGHDHFGVQPDIVITAKGLASGFPLSAIAASRELMQKAWPGSQGGTYGANAATQGARMLEGARQIADKHPAIGDVRGLGLLVGSEFTTADGQPDTTTAQRAHAAAVERGMLLLTCGAYGNVVRMIPPLVVTGEQIDEALDIWADAVAEATSPVAATAAEGA